MLVIQQQVFSHYRLPIFQDILSGKTGIEARLLFGANRTTKSLKTYQTIDEIPEHDDIQRSQYRLLKNHHFTKTILWQSGLLREVLRRDVECIVFAGDAHHLSTWFCALAARLFGKRVGFWSHGSQKQKRGLKACIAKAFWKIPHFFLLYGDQGKRNLEKAGVPTKKLYPIRNSLDYPRQAEIRDSISKEKLKEDRAGFFKHPELPVLLWVGRMIPKRRLDLLVLAAEKLHKEGEKVNLLFVGPGDERASLEKMIADANLQEYSHFYGPCYQEEELARLFMLSDSVVSPGFIGLTCIHAITYGVPVVTSDDWDNQVPEIDAIIPNKTGVFFRTEDVNDLAAKIIQTINLEKQTPVYYDLIRLYFSQEYQCKVFNAAFHNQPPTGWEEFDDYKRIHAQTRVE